MSVQLKKLNEAGFIKIKKQFVRNIPLTICKITSKGKKSFEVFFDELQSYKNLKNGQ